MQLAALCASLIGRWVHSTRHVCGCWWRAGAAAGITSAYKRADRRLRFLWTEIVLGSIAMESFGPVVVVASVVATSRCANSLATSRRTKCRCSLL